MEQTLKMSGRVQKIFNWWMVIGIVCLCAALYMVSTERPQVGPRGPVGPAGSTGPRGPQGPPAVPLKVPDYGVCVDQQYGTGVSFVGSVSAPVVSRDGTQSCMSGQFVSVKAAPQ